VTRSLDDVEVEGKRVLLRVDINSPLDPETGRIADTNRIERSVPTIRELADRGARLVIIAHQGDTLDYHNLASIAGHAPMLADHVDRPVSFVDDVAGPEARKRIMGVGNGEILLLENLRTLTEEVSTFERDVKLTASEMTATYLVRHLAPLFDLYVNDAFAAAHRNAPSMVAFQQVLPSAAGRLLQAELEALEAVSVDPARPCVYMLGGLKISDAFSMLGKVLADGSADLVLTGGITGQIFLVALGHDIGEPSMRFITDRSLEGFVPEAEALLEGHPDRIRAPLDLAYVDENGSRVEVDIADLPAPGLIVDIGATTIHSYRSEIAAAATVFVNGPPGAYEQEAGRDGTVALWEAVAGASAQTVIGGGDTVASFRRFTDASRLDFVSTGGGALVRFLAGQPLPLLEAMKSRA
jgi:phosphoglycerate kinase